MIYLAHYRTHQSLDDMNNSVSNHIYNNHEKLTKSDKAVLQCLASHSLQYVGACHLKLLTIAEEIGVSLKTVQRAIKKLMDLHVIIKHNTRKKLGQTGANIYSIQFFKTNNVHANVQQEMSKPATHETPRSSKVEHVNLESVSFNSFNLSLNPFVNKDVITYSAHDKSTDIKQQLRAVYNPQTVEANHSFEELCKIAFGQLKKYMRTHQMPYLQMEQIVLKAMNDLIRKQNVNNQFAMYSAMIKRQVEQLFEAPVKPIQAFNKPSKELIPDWFEQRNQPCVPSKNETGTVDFEAERQKILAKLG